MPSSSNQSESHTPAHVKHRHRPTATPGIYTSSSGKPSGLRWECKYFDRAKKKQTWSPAFKYRKDALRYQAEVTVKQDTGTVIGNPSKTLGALVTDWKIVRDTRVRATTAQAQDMHLARHILPALGHEKVREISRGTILTWQAGLARTDGKGPLSPNTVNLIRTTLSSVLDFAVAEGIIAINPCHTLTRADKPKRSQAERTILAPGDFDLLVAAVGRRSWFADVLDVTLAQALRLGEVAGLDWKDVDFERNELTIARSVSKKSGEVGPTKGGTAETIFLSPVARKTLARIHLAAGRPPSGPVFSSVGSVQGGYRHPSTIERAFADAYKKSGVKTPGLSMHSLRHTAISRLANNPKVPLDKVRRFARHSSITITQTYMHDVQTPEVNEAMGEALAAVAGEVEA